MRAAYLAICLFLSAVPALCGAQIIEDKGSAVAGSYLGLNVGVADYRWRNPTVPVTKDFCPAGTFDCKNDPVGWKLTAGYMIWPYFGLEGEFFTMGDGHAKTDLGGGSTMTQKVNIAGYGLSMVGALPLGPVSLNGRLGWAATTLTRKDDVDGGNVYRNSHTRGEPLIGVGIGFQVWRGMFVRLDWDRARATSSLGEKFEADLYSAGIGWRF